MRWHSFVRSCVVHDLLWSQVRDGGLICCLMPGRLPVADTSRRSSGDGPISGVQILKFLESAGDPEKLSVDTPTFSSTVTAGSGSDDEVVVRRSVRTGETRRSGKTTTINHFMRWRYLRSGH
ncbi:hypothetical protein EVAR_66668_1 [Eumeta japonica]|uniref:Uncharacterized protein n=1 Tax=Eumeta variegata TaxID=151549 RepID=A0A4C1ZAF9_EUMVA|nr:hypothetical protein EVAR_66668_1 [Eumeta japonica]